jgi:hypothetical protein
MLIGIVGDPFHILLTTPTKAQGVSNKKRVPDKQVSV